MSRPEISPPAGSAPDRRAAVDRLRRSVESIKRRYPTARRPRFAEGARVLLDLEDRALERAAGILGKDPDPERLEALADTIARRYRRRMGFPADPPDPRKETP